MSITVSVIGHPDHEPTQVEADQVHHAHTGAVSILLRLRIAGSSLTGAGPARVLRVLLTVELAALDRVDPERGDHHEVRQPFTPPRPAVLAPTPGGGRVTGRPPDLARTTVVGLLAEALDRIGGFPPGRRTLVDQNTAILRARLARAGLPVTPLTVAGFLAGVAKLDYQAARTSGVRAAAVSLRHAAAQLVPSGGCLGCVADLDRALAAPDATSPRLRGALGHRPRAGGTR